MNTYAVSARCGVVAQGLTCRGFGQVQALRRLPQGCRIRGRGHVGSRAVERWGVRIEAICGVRQTLRDEGLATVLHATIKRSVKSTFQEQRIYSVQSIIMMNNEIMKIYTSA